MEKKGLFDLEKRGCGVDAHTLMHAVFHIIF
jgi:hypothetical protein